MTPNRAITDHQKKVRSLARELSTTVEELRSHDFNRLKMIRAMCEEQANYKQQFDTITRHNHSVGDFVQAAYDNSWFPGVIVQVQATDNEPKYLITFMEEGMSNTWLAHYQVREAHMSPSVLSVESVTINASTDETSFTKRKRSTANTTKERVYDGKELQVSKPRKTWSIATLPYRRNRIVVAFKRTSGHGEYQIPNFIR